MAIPLRRRLLVLAVVLALVLGAVGLAVGAGTSGLEGPIPTARPIRPAPEVDRPGLSDPPPGQGLARYTNQPITWRPCRDGLRCASVLAPLDYTRPDGPAVTLALAQRVSRQARRGTLFLNPGGPGGSGIDMVDSFDSAGLTAYDLVGWDPRGVGESTPVSCFGGSELEAYVTADVSPDDAEEREDLLRDQEEFGSSCLERSGALLEHVSTTETVRDLELLRMVLGQERLNFLGFSYGTQIGAIYAQLYGPRVGRMVLDGATDLSDVSPVPQAAGFERSLRAFARWCANQRCALGGDEEAVVARITDLWRRLDGKPQRVGGRRLNQTLAVGGVLVTLYEDERAYPVLRGALERAVRGDGGELLRLADIFTRRQRDGSYGQENYAFPAVRCRDSSVTTIAEVDRRTARQDAAAPVLGPFIGPDAVCALWPVSPAPALPRITAPDAPPLLVVGSTGDSATPYEWAQDMARQLESAVLLTRRGAGHTGYSRSPCIKRLVQRYLMDGRLPRDGTTCS